MTESHRSGPLTVAVLGAGIVGRTLATGWGRTGHRVLVGTREPASPRIAEVLADLEARGAAGVSAATHAEAAASADVVVLTVPGDQVADLVTGLGDALAGRPCIDTTNNLAPGAPSRHGLAIVAAAGGVPYRAFNTVGWEQMERPRFGAQVADLPFAGPESHLEAVRSLVADIGFRPLYLGEGPGAVDAVDALARLWFLLAFERGMGRRVALRVLTAEDDAPEGSPADGGGDG